MNKSRIELFADWLPSAEGFDVIRPVPATTEDLLLFHTPEYVSLVRESSRLGEGFLDYADTPSFRGVYEASVFPVGSTLDGLGLVLEGRLDHFFNPVGGLHHAREGKAGGFCVFNDAAIAIRRALSLPDIERVAYVDIDAHHGDGVFYGFESDPRVIIGDIHEDGRSLYPGTGRATETGTGDAAGTKLNIPLPPGAGDAETEESPDEIHHLIIVPLASLDLASMRALAYAASLQQPVLAVHVSPTDEEGERFRSYWSTWGDHLPLEVVVSPYRALVAPMVNYIESLHRLSPDLTLTVILPEIVVERSWQRILHNQTAPRLRRALRPLPKIVVTTVPFHLPSPRALKQNDRSGGTFAGGR